ncbi:MAG: copper chaperone PCu(A)C [Caldimonas sp.]|uniref:copper chaperone PCu(A)C n=1 Tax=Caldimonas sp. TaxID=2838790 RepID=UPI00391C43FE
MMMKTLSRRALLIAACAVAAPALAHDYRVGDLVIDHPWARATVPGQKAGGAFLTIENRGGQADRLLSAAAPTERVGRTEMHSMRMEGNVMRMREIDAIDIPAGQTVTLKPGGLHLMFMGLTAPLKAGEKLPVVLTFERSGTITVEVHVQAASAASAKNPDGDSHHKH